MGLLMRKKNWQNIIHWHLIEAPAESAQTLKLLSLTKQQLEHLQGSTTLSLKQTEFFCKPSS